MTRQLRYRIIILIAGLCGFGGMVALNLLNLRWWYNRLFSLWGVSVNFDIPFVDISDFFAALECHRKGIDVFLINPCDVLDRPHVYPVLLDLWRFLDFGTAATPYAGLALGFGFVCTVAWISNPKTISETAIYILALFSSTVAFALERANMDIVIFILLVCACRLYGRGRWERIGTYSLIFIATLLKFYPIATMGLLLKEKKSRLIAIVFPFAAGCMGFLFAARHDLMEIIILRPSAYGDGIGAKNIREIAENILKIIFPLQFQSVALASNSFFVLVLVSSIFLSIIMARNAIRSGVRPHPQDFEATLFMAGGFIIVGIFFVDVSVCYRAILLLTLLPLLISSRRNPMLPPQFRRLMHGAILVMIVLLWFEFFHYNSHDLIPGFASEMALVMLVKEPLWWLLITIIMSVLWIQLYPVWPFSRLMKPSISNTTAGSIDCPRPPDAIDVKHGFVRNQRRVFWLNGLR